ncbi:MAG: hypothetical protein R2877_04430 [Bdellovibrionota bacterium]
MGVEFNISVRMAPPTQPSFIACHEVHRLDVQTVEGMSALEKFIFAHGTYGLMALICSCQIPIHFLVMMQKLKDVNSLVNDFQLDTRSATTFE